MTSRKLILAFALLSLAALSIGKASAQTATVGAPTPLTGAEPAKPKKEKPPRGGPKLESVLNKTLRLNGVDGELILARKKDALTIAKLTLSGETLSDASQRCEIQIRGESPIAVHSLGKVDGLLRFDADLPACPFRFDLLAGAVLTPPELSACVFQAANCQANPGGMWGPSSDELQKDAKAIAKERDRAEKTLAAELKALLERYKGKPEATELSGEEEAFAQRREEVCRAYSGEQTIGFCAARMTAARVAMLADRLAALKGKPDDTE